MQYSRRVASDKSPPEDRSAWMSRVGFSDLKLNLMGAIAAISGVDLLEAFIDVEEVTLQASLRRSASTSHSSLLACYLQ